MCSVLQNSQSFVLFPWLNLLFMHCRLSKRKLLISVARVVSNFSNLLSPKDSVTITKSCCYQHCCDAFRNVGANLKTSISKKYCVMWEKWCIFMVLTDYYLKIFYSAQYTTSFKKTERCVRVYPAPSAGEYKNKTRLVSRSGCVRKDTSWTTFGLFND